METGLHERNRYYTFNLEIDLSIGQINLSSQILNTLTRRLILSATQVYASAKIRGCINHNRLATRNVAGESRSYLKSKWNSLEGKKLENDGMRFSGWWNVRSGSEAKTHPMRMGRTIIN